MEGASVAEPIAEVGWITIDCLDPERLSGFWTEVLGVEEDSRIGEPAQYVMLKAPAPGVIPLQFQRVPEAKQGKNRLHLDLTVTDIESVAARVQALGGSRGPEGDFDEAGYRWRVMADPEGNEFCLVFAQPA